TKRERARFYTLDTKTFGDQEVEPAAGFGVFRAQQEFGPSASTVGGMVTAVRRDLAGSDPLAGLLPRQAITGSADWNLRFDDGAYQVVGHTGGSYVSG